MRRNLPAGGNTGRASQTYRVTVLRQVLPRNINRTQHYGQWTGLSCQTRNQTSPKYDTHQNPQMVDVETVYTYVIKSVSFNGRQYASQRLTATLIHSHLFTLDGIGHLPLCILDI